MEERGRADVEKGVIAEVEERARADMEERLRAEKRVRALEERVRKLNAMEEIRWSTTNTMEEMHKKANKANLKLMADMLKLCIDQHNQLVAKDSNVAKDEEAPTVQDELLGRVAFSSRRGGLRVKQRNVTAVKKEKGVQKKKPKKLKDVNLKDVKPKHKKAEMEKEQTKKEKEKAKEEKDNAKRENGFMTANEISAAMGRQNRKKLMVQTKKAGDDAATYSRPRPSKYAMGPKAATKAERKTFRDQTRYHSMKRAYWGQKNLTAKENVMKQVAKTAKQGKTCGAEYRGR